MVKPTLHQRLRSTASDASGAALDDLLDGYGYESPPKTPIEPSAPENSLPGKLVTATTEEDHSARPPGHRPEEVAKDTTNPGVIKQIDITSLPPKEMSKPAESQSSAANPPTRLEMSKPVETQYPTVKPPTPPTDESGSFLTDVLNAFDTKEPAPSTLSPSVPPASTALRAQDSKHDSTPKSPEVTSPTTDPSSYASSNYWAQMRANLKTKHSVSVTQDMSRTASHKTDDSSMARSSNESSRSTKPNFPPVSSDGRSGSFTSYTPIPKFPESRPRRPSSPGLGLPGVRYGRPARPTIDTSGRTMSLTDAPRRDFASDMKRPLFDGRGSNPSSPVMGNSPFAPTGSSGSGSRPSSRQRNRDDDIARGNLPVFAPREVLHSDMRSRSIERGPGPRPQSPARPQSPLRGASPTPLSQNVRVASPTPRSPNPVRVVSPTPPPARPQSPARGTRGLSPAGNIIPLGPDTKSRTPSSLKEGPVQEPKESLVPQHVVRTPSPLHGIPEEKETQKTGLPPARTVSPQKPAPIQKDTQVAITLPEVPPKDSFSPASRPSQLRSITQNVPSQNVPPESKEKIGVPSITPIVMPVTESPIDRNESPSPDPEWREEEEEQVSPIDKRTTIFLQEASRKKDSLPPLPTELPPPVPQLRRVLASEEPVNVEQKVATPLIPQPSTPVLESQFPRNGTDSSAEQSGKAQVSTDARRSIESTASRPVSVTYPNLKHDSSPVSPTTYPSPKQPQREPPPPSHPPPETPTKNPSRPTHKKNTSSVISAFSWRSRATSSPRASSEHRRTPSANPSTPSDGSVQSSPAIQLPELDVSRPITWGPLAFAAVSSSPGKGEDVPEVPRLPSRRNREKVKVPQIPKTVLSLDLGGPRLDEPLNLNPVNVAKESPIRSPESSSRSRSKAIQEKDAEATAPPVSESDDVPVRDLDKGKPPEIEEEDAILNTEAMSCDDHTDAESTFIRSKYVDRDITSFITSASANNNRNSNRNSSRPSTPKFANLPTLQIPPVPEESVIPPLTPEMLPDYMRGSDIPEMSTVAQRIGAYQSRREQMIKADTGLRTWLLHVQTIRKPDLPQRISPASD